MFLAPDAAEIAIADTAAKFLSRTIPLDRLHGAAASPGLSAGVRADFAALGWFGLVVPEADGGSGLSAVEHALFYREIGRQCGPVAGATGSRGDGPRRCPRAGARRRSAVGAGLTSRRCHLRRHRGL